MNHIDDCIEIVSDRCVTCTAKILDCTCNYCIGPILVIIFGSVSFVFNITVYHIIPETIMFPIAFILYVTRKNRLNKLVKKWRSTLSDYDKQVVEFYIGGRITVTRLASTKILLFKQLRDMCNFDTYHFTYNQVQFQNQRVQRKVKYVQRKFLYVPNYFYELRSINSIVIPNYDSEIFADLSTMLNNIKKDKGFILKETNLSIIDQNECSICLEAVDYQNKNACITNCNHVFHKQCLVKVINKLCPLCRRNLEQIY
jgi:hypothetical protein